MRQKNIALHLEWINNKALMYSTGNYIQYPVINDNGKEIKRRLLLGSKVMTNLDSILKIRGITLLTKLHLVKAMVFPVIMYECESWTTEH